MGLGIGKVQPSFRNKIMRIIFNIQSGCSCGLVDIAWEMLLGTIRLGFNFIEGLMARLMYLLSP